MEYAPYMFHTEEKVVISNVDDLDIFTDSPDQLKIFYIPTEFQI